MNKLIEWFEEGVALGATHMIVVYDTSSRDLYPVFVKPEEDVQEKVKPYGDNDSQGLPRLENVNMSMVDAVYLLSRTFNEQYVQRNPFNFS